jgi:hypothetical protein
LSLAAGYGLNGATIACLVLLVDPRRTPDSTALVIHKGTLTYFPISSFCADRSTPP